MYLVRLVRPKSGNVGSAEVDSYYEIIAKSQEEAEAFIMKEGLWGGTLAERIAHRIGKRGEAHAMAMLSPGRQVYDASTGQILVFDAVKQYQNASGHGVDILGRLAKDAEPDPPPFAGDFFSFEVKSTLGAVDDPPRLSGEQKDAVRFTRTRLERASKGSGAGYPELSDSDADILDEAMLALRKGRMHFRKIDARLDHSGNPGSANGKPSMEIKSWP